MAKQLTNDALQAAQDRADEREADEWDELEKTLEPCPQCGPKGQPVIELLKGVCYAECHRCGFRGPGANTAILAAGEWNTRWRDDFELVKAVKRFLGAEAVVREAPAVTGKQSVEWLNALSSLKELFPKN